MTLAVRSRFAAGLVAGVGGDFGVVVVVGFVAVGAAVHAFVTHVIQGLEMLLIVLAGDEAFLDVALDRAAIVEARSPWVLVTSHGGPLASTRRGNILADV